jgi:hypothetical protein
VAHACNPSYAGGRDQEDRSSESAQANSLRDRISKNRAGGVAERVGPELKTQYHNGGKKVTMLE